MNVRPLCNGPISLDHDLTTLITISPRSSRFQDRGESVVRAWSIGGPLRLHYDITASLPRSCRAQHDFTTLHATLHTALALRLRCAHCVLTTIMPITLRPSDAFAACMPRSSRLHCALTTLLLRLYHVLITPSLRYDMISCCPTAVRFILK
jgi:hypothetical protein